MQIFSKLFYREMVLDWIQPTLSSNGTPFVDELAVEEVVVNSKDTYKVLNGDGTLTAPNWKNLDFIIYSKTPIKLSAVKLKDGPNYPTTGGEFYYSDDGGSNWTLISTFAETLQNDSYLTFDAVTQGFHKTYRVFLNKARTYDNGNRHVNCGGLTLVGEYEERI